VDLKGFFQCASSNSGSDGIRQLDNFWLLLIDKSLSFVNMSSFQDIPDLFWRPD
jgi:hypothetical protein